MGPKSTVCCVDTTGCLCKKAIDRPKYLPGFDCSHVSGTFLQTAATFLQTAATPSSKHLSNESAHVCFSSLDLIDALFILFASVSVRRKGDCSQVCPLASFQKAFLWDPGRTCSGPAPFLAESYSAASAGYKDCNELQMQAF